MKKQLLLFSLFGLFLAGCTSNDAFVIDENVAGGSGKEEIASNFLAVTLRPSNGIGGTRAEDPDEPKVGADGDFVDGSSDENNVTSVRFFFFDADGNATPVRQNIGSGGYNSFIDWYPNPGDERNPTEKEQEETVEKVLSATLGVNTPAPWVNPAQVVAIVNPTSAVLDLCKESKEATGETEETEEVKIYLYGPALDQLKNCVEDFKTGLMTDNFVMSNSVYVGTNESVCYATALEEENFGQSIEEAEKNRVTIYVERVLARLDFYVNINNDIKDADGNTIPVPTDNPTLYPVWRGTVGGKDEVIYIKLLGWNITATPNKSRLEKVVNPDWTHDSLFGGAAVWNSSTLHRSFWALNPDPENDEFKYLYGNFGDNVSEETPDPEETPDSEENSNSEDNPYPANSLEIPASTTTYTTTYLQENANSYSAEMTEAAPDPATKVIIAARLCDAKGKPVPLAEWSYRKYTLDGLKKELAGTVLNNLYKWSGTTGTQIEEQDLTFKTAKQLGTDFNNAGDADYYVYVVLTEDAEEYTWTLGKEQPTEQNTLSAEKVNNIIRDHVNHVMLWNNGNTYYYFDIRHLGGEGSEGEYGIVRNHLYQTTVTSITGLGTPVYDPDQVIYPEKPEPDESIVSADVKILQWRIVKDDYKLEW